MKKSLRFKTRKWRRQFVLFRRCHRWASGATVAWMSEIANICFFFLKISFGLARELSSLFFVGFIVVVEEIYTSVARDFGDIWAYNVFFLQLGDCCFSCTMIRKLFSHLPQGKYELWVVFIMLLIVFSPFGLIWTRYLSLNLRFRLLLW